MGQREMPLTSFNFLKDEARKRPLFGGIKLPQVCKLRSSFACDHDFDEAVQLARRCRQRGEPPVMSCSAGARDKLDAPTSLSKMAHLGFSTDPVEVSASRHPNAQLFFHSRP
jgi:hypothetical protein